jgi:hypothetical protein
MVEVTRMLPGGAPDDETQDLMARLSDLQMWCFLMGLLYKAYPSRFGGSK